MVDGGCVVLLSHNMCVNHHHYKHIHHHHHHYHHSPISSCSLAASMSCRYTDMNQHHYKHINHCHYNPSPVSSCSLAASMSFRDPRIIDKDLAPLSPTHPGVCGGCFRSSSFTRDASPVLTTNMDWAGSP